MVAKRRRPKLLTTDDKLDLIVLALVGDVDYDHAKQLDEATAEEPDYVPELRERLRATLLRALKEHGFALPSGSAGDR